MKLPLQKEWEKRLKTLSEIQKNMDKAWEFYSKRDRLIDKSKKLLSEAQKAKDKGAQLSNEGLKLHINIQKRWTVEVRKVYGNIKIEWKSGECHLENGEIYKP